MFLVDFLPCMVQSLIMTITDVLQDKYVVFYEHASLEVWIFGIFAEVKTSL